MTLKECIFTANDCYKKDMKIEGKPYGIVVHSTGAPNKTLKRYVQPLRGDANYSTIIDDIGLNKYDNDWNRPRSSLGRSVCVHAFIGVNANNKVETYQTLPYDVCCWGCGQGSRGSFNYNPTAKIQFEICEDNLTDRVYFESAFKEAIEYSAYLCKMFDIPVDKITSHAESYKLGYASNHADCDNWLSKFGKTMDWFRSEVEKVLNSGVDNQPVEPDKTDSDNYLYVVQEGAFKDKSNANELVDKLKAKGFDAYLVFEDGLYKVRNGAFKNKLYAEDLAKKTNIAGFDCYIQQIKTSSTQEIPKFSVGDKIKIKTGVTRFSDGVKMLAFVTTATLYVRAIEDNGKILLVSTEKTKAVYTGRVNAEDCYEV